MTVITSATTSNANDRPRGRRINSSVAASAIGSDIIVRPSGITSVTM